MLSFQQIWKKNHLTKFIPLHDKKTQEMGVRGHSLSLIKDTQDKPTLSELLNAEIARTLFPRLGIQQGNSY